MSGEHVIPKIYAFSVYAEEMDWRRNIPSRAKRPCVLCGEQIPIVERDYQMAGICCRCAHQIVEWYAEAHGDGWASLCGLETERGRTGRGSKKRQISASKRVAVWRRDGFKCVKCGSTEELHADHVFPESRGGSSDMDNLQTLCATCNRRKGARVEAPPVQPSAARGA